MHATRRQPRKPARPAVQAQPVVVDWQPVILCAVRAADRYMPLTMAQLLARAKSLVPTLTLDAFHTGMKSLRAAGLVRFDPWTGPLSQMDSAAMEYHGEWMHWVQPA